MKNPAMIVLLLSSVALAGCGGKPLKKDFSTATHNNVGKQTLNQHAPDEDVEHTLDGAKAERVIERYRDEKAQTSESSLIKN